MQTLVSPNNHLGGREPLAAIISSSDKKHLRRFWSFDDFFKKSPLLGPVFFNFVNVTGGSFDFLYEYLDHDHQLILTC